MNNALKILLAASVLCYCLFTFAGYFAASLEQHCVLRFLACLGIILTTPSREGADPLDVVQQPLALLLDEHPPEEIGEQADVRTQSCI